MFLKQKERIKIIIDKLYRFFDRATLFFLCVLIFFIPISKAAIQISVSLTILSFIAVSFLKRFKNIPKTELNIPLLVFFISLCVSVAFAIDFKTALITLLKKNIEWFLLFFIVVATLNTKRRLKIFLGVLFFSALCVAFDGVYQQITGVDLFRGHIYKNKMSASFNHYNDFAGYLEVILPIAFSFFIFTEQKILKIFFGLFTALLGYCLISSGSRGGLLSVFLALIFLMVFFLLKAKNKKILIFRFIILLFLLSLFSFIGNTILLEHAQSPWSGSLERLDSGRRFMWGVANEMIKKNPLFGIGLGSFMKLYLPYKDLYTGIPEPKVKGYAYTAPLPSYAHNCYIQMVAEAGIFGLLSFLSIVVLFFIKGIKTFNKNNDFLLLGFLSGILAYLIHAGLDTHLYSMQLSDFFWIMLGLVFAIIKIGQIEI